MSSEETDAEFLKRVGKFVPTINGVHAILDSTLSRLLRLAYRVARVPDEPTEKMVEAARYSDAMLGDPIDIYRAMLRTAPGEKE